MRTTVNLDSDVAAAVDRLRRERDIGLSEAVNELVRMAMSNPPRRKKNFEQPTEDIGLRIDVSDVAEALDVLDADRDVRPDHRQGDRTAGRRRS